MIEALVALVLAFAKKQHLTETEFLLYEQAMSLLEETLRAERKVS